MGSLVGAMEDVQIIIPMTGNGSRFSNAGFKYLKPFIKVHDRPIIEWVCDLFPNYSRAIKFICRDEHLRNLNYVGTTLNDIAPNAAIFSVENWNKLGPVYDIMCVEEYILDDIPVVISYCDFFMLWDFQKFLRQVLERGYDGAIPCYSGFHPHLLRSDNLYASCKVDDEKMLKHIREKHSWTADKKLSLHSPGIYYFKTGKMMKEYFRRLIENQDTVNGEFYASSPFNYLVEDGLKVWCPTNVSHFCQWGTPYDLDNYLFWSDICKKQESLIK